MQENPVLRMGSPAKAHDPQLKSRFPGNKCVWHPRFRPIIETVTRNSPASLSMVLAAHETINSSRASTTFTSTISLIPFLPSIAPSSSSSILIRKPALLRCLCSYRALYTPEPSFLQHSFNFSIRSIILPLRGERATVNSKL